jgi:uncharacterized membrane protein YccC
MGTANGGGRHTLAQGQLESAVEDGLFYLEEQREFGVKRARLLKIIGGLEEAGRIDMERARNRVARARTELRDAEEECAHVEEINEQEREVLGELVELDRLEEQSALEGKSRISIDGTAAGFAYARKELLEPGALKRLVKDRKVRVGLSNSEMEVM